MFLLVSLASTLTCLFACFFDLFFFCDGSCLLLLLRSIHVVLNLGSRTIFLTSIWLRKPHLEHIYRNDRQKTKKIQKERSF